MPSGVYGSTISDCVIASDALVQNVSLLARTVVGPEAIVMSCGTVTCTGETTFGAGIDIPIAVEVGGREVCRSVAFGVVL